MVERFRLMPADPQVSEIEIVEHTAEGFNALLEDLLRMRLAEACIIEGGDHGFSTACYCQEEKPS